jgi:hypothetical protein
MSHVGPQLSPRRREIAIPLTEGGPSTRRRMLTTPEAVADDVGFSCSA